MKQPKSAIADMHVIVDLHGPRHAATVAADIAVQLEAHLTGLALAFEPLIPVYPMAAPIPTEAIVAARDAAMADAKTAVAAFEKIANAAGAAFDSRPLESIVGEGFTEIVEACRLSDLVVIGQSDPDQPEPLRTGLIEAVLFDAAAPTLLVPYAGVSALKTGRVLVAWDGSAEAGRALRAAMPLLRRTSSVMVIMVSEAEKWTGGIPGADIADHLARHGLKVEVRRLDNPMHDIGATLLNAVSDEEADWMVMGAYGHSRLRQLLIGGVTRAVLASATVPVLMAH